jgi:hypothetical protein
MMEEMMANDDFKKTETYVKVIASAAISFFFVTLIFYANQFSGGLSDETSVWGTFGDFMGGITSPIISMATLLIVAMAYLAQKKELAETVKSLVASATEQARQNEIALLQARIDIKTALMNRQLQALAAVRDEVSRVASVEEGLISETKTILTVFGDSLDSPKDRQEYIDSQWKKIDDSIASIQRFENDLHSLDVELLELED